MDVYSPLLALAIVAVVVSLVSTVVRRPRVGVPAGIVALLAVTIAAVSHVVVGHPPGSASALGFAAFLREHPAVWVTAATATAGLVLSLRAGGTLRRPLA